MVFSPHQGGGEKVTKMAEKRKVRRYDELEKQRGVDYAREHSIKEASRYFGVAPSTIDGWMRRSPPNGEARSLFKVPGLPSFSIDGLLSVLQAKRDEAMELATQYDGAIGALTQLTTLDAELFKLQQEKLEHQKALVFFLKENKSSGDAKAAGYKVEYEEEV